MRNMKYKRDRIITVCWYWETQNQLPNVRELSKIAGCESSIKKSVATIVTCMCVFLFLSVWQIAFSKRTEPTYVEPPCFLHKEAVISCTERWSLFPTLGYWKAHWVKIWARKLPVLGLLGGGRQDGRKIIWIIYLCLIYKITWWLTFF